MATSAEFKLSLENIKLDDLTTVTVSTEALRLNFEVILHALKSFNKKLDANEHEFKETSEEIFNNITQFNIRMQGIEGKEADNSEQIEKRFKDLEDRNKEMMIKMNEVTSTLDITKTEVSEIKGDISQIKEDIAQFKIQFENLANQVPETPVIQEKNIVHEKVIVETAPPQPAVDLTPLMQRLDGHDKSMQEVFDRLKRLSYNLNKLAANQPLDQEKEEKELTVNDEFMDMLNEIREEIYSMRNNNSALEEFKTQMKDFLENYVTKRELEEFQSKTDIGLERFHQSIDDIYGTLQEFKEKIHNKVDCDPYDEHINDFNRVKAILISLVSSKLADDSNKSDMLSQLNTTSSSGLSTKDANMLKEISTKFPEFENTLKKVQKDLGDHIYQTKIFTEETNKKTLFLDETQRRFKEEALKRIHALEDSVKILQGGFDKMETLKSNANPGSISSKDMNKFGTSINDLTANLKKIQSQVLVILDSDKERDTKLQKLFEEVSEIKQLKIRLNNLSEFANDNRSKVSNLEEEVNELRALQERIELIEAAMQKESKKVHKRNEEQENKPPGIAIEEVKKLIHDAVEALKEEIMKLIEDAKNIASKKVEAEDLWKSESLILEKLDQVVGGLIKKLADKGDTKKAILLLEKKIKEINVLIFGDPTQGEDGAMFAKKPLIPWTCASCDSKLQKYPGPLIEHKSWNKLPPNEVSPDVITQGKFGKGWNRWADKQKNPDKLRESAKDAQILKSSIESLPDIHQNPHNVKEDTKNPGKQFDKLRMGIN